MRQSTITAKLSYGPVWLVMGVLAGVALTLALLAPGGAGAQEGEELEPAAEATGMETLAVVPVEVDFHEDTTVWIYGSGFEPGTEVTLMVEDRNGILSDITAMTEEFPLTANDHGAFGTAWTLDRFTHEEVGEESMQSLWAVDNQFNSLASAPIAFCRISDRAEVTEEEPVDPEAEAEEAPAEGEAAEGEEDEEEVEEDEVPGWCSQ